VKSVLFTFKRTAPVEEQDQLLNTIRSLPEVQGTGRMHPSPDNSLFRTGYVYVSDHVDASQLTEKLKSFDGIEDAFLPAERHL
jgi:hypothetical protein